MAAPKRYDITTKSVMQWAEAELAHVGRIASVMDPDIQYAYAMSTLNGMAHLKDALYELVTDPVYEHHHEDLQRTHDAVVRTMKHLKKEYALDVDAIRAFNTRGTLSNLDYLEDAPAAANTANESLEYTNYVPLEEEGEYASTDRVKQDGGRRKRRSYRRRRHSSVKKASRNSNRRNAFRR